MPLLQFWPDLRPGIMRVVCYRNGENMFRSKGDYAGPNPCYYHAEHCSVHRMDLPSFMQPDDKF